MHYSFLRIAGVLCCVFMGTGVAQAENWYATLHGGMGIGPTAEGYDSFYDVGLKTEAEMGFVVAGVIGWQATKSFSVEGEVSYRRNGLNEISYRENFGAQRTGTVDSDGSWTNLAFMMNGRYQMPTASSFTPFGLIGLGVANAEVKVTEIENYSVDIEEDDTVFAFQAGAGVAYALSPTVAIEVSYRFFGTMEPDLGSATVENYHHNGLVGLTYSF